jgi:hypothetical protein
MPVPDDVGRSVEADGGGVRVEGRWGAGRGVGADGGADDAGRHVSARRESCEHVENLIESHGM